MLTVGLMVAIAAVASSVRVGSEGVRRFVALQAKRQELGAAAVRRQQENAALQAEITRLQTDPRYLEALARKRLGLVRSDEFVYRFRAPDEP
jgi:cell division protein FtsB